MAIQGSRSNTYLFGDVIETGVCAVPGERFLRYFENPFAIPLGIGAGLSWDGFRVFF